MKIQEIIPSVMEPKKHDLISSYVKDNLEEFRSVLEECPVPDQVGGISTCEAFWLYCIVRDLAPAMVVESGTLYEFSLWFIEKALDGRGGLYSFDPGPYEVKYHSPSVRYYKMDWKEVFPVDPERKDLMVFFDDHQHQGQRLGEARDRGAMHVIFHDNYETTGHSHMPVRFCMIPDVWKFCSVLDPIYGETDPIFAVGENAQTYRWLTWIGRGE